MNPLKLLIPLRWIGVILLVFLIWQTAVWLMPDPVPLTVPQLAAVQQSVTQILSSLDLDPAATATDIGLVRWVNDPTGEGTDLFREELERHPAFTVVDDSPFQRLFKDLGRSVKNATTPGEIAFAGREVSLPLLALGRIIQLPTPEDPTLTVWLAIYDTRKGNWMHRQSHTLTWTPEEYQNLQLMEGPATGNRQSSPSTVKWVWLLAVLALPWITLPLFHPILEKKSNLANGAWLLTLTLLGLASGAWIFRIDFQKGPGFWPILTGILLAIYNLLTLDRIAGKA